MNLLNSPEAALGFLAACVAPRLPLRGQAIWRGDSMAMLNPSIDRHRLSRRAGMR